MAWQRIRKYLLNSIYCSLLAMLSDSREKIGNCLSCLSCIGNIIAYKAADEPTNIMPVLLILKAIIYEDEVHKFMRQGST